MERNFKCEDEVVSAAASARVRDVHISPELVRRPSEP